MTWKAGQFAALLEPGLVACDFCSDVCGIDKPGRVRHPVCCEVSPLEVIRGHGIQTAPP